MATYYATGAQMKYINKLIVDWELDDAATQKIVEHVGATSLDDLDIEQASNMIDTLKGPIGHIIRPEDFVGKNIYGEEIKEDEEREPLDPATLCDCDLDKECSCGAVSVEDGKDQTKEKEAETTSSPIIKKVYSQAITLDFGYSNPKSVLKNAKIYEGYECLQGVLDGLLGQGDQVNASYSKVLDREEYHVLMAGGWRHPHNLNEQGKKVQKAFYDKMIKTIQFYAKANHNVTLVAVREGFEVWESGKVDLLAMEKIYN